MRNLTQYIRGVPGRSADIRKLFSKKNLYPSQPTKMLEDRDYLFFRDGGSVRSAHYNSLIGKLIIMNCEEIFLEDVVFKFKIGDKVRLVNEERGEILGQNILKVKKKTIDDEGKPVYFLDNCIIPLYDEEELVLYTEEPKK